MPVTNSFRWNRIQEDFEEFYGAEMQPFLNPAFIEEEEEVLETVPCVEPERINPLLNLKKEGHSVFSSWMKLMIGKIKGTQMRLKS